MSAFFVFISLIAFDTSVYAKNLCGTEIYVNDPNAVIFVDKKKYKKPKLFVACAKEPKLIRILAPEKKIFTRYVPAHNSAEPIHDSWNVRLESRSDLISANSEGEDLAAKNDDQNKLPAKGIKTKVKKKLIVSLKSSKDQRLNTDATVLDTDKKPVEAKLEISTQAKTVKLKPLSRKISAEAAELKPYDLQVVNGLYIQVAAFAHSKTKESFVKFGDTLNSEALSEHELVFCPTIIRNEKWTAALIGPVKDHEVAQQVLKKNGKDSFLIQDPKCDLNSKFNYQGQNGKNE